MEKEPTIEYPKRLVGYCRVSTDGQKEEKTIEIQRHALREYVEKKGYELSAIFCDEGISGGLEDRPGLSELFDHLEAQADVDGVLIFKLDRLARDLYIQEHLIKKLEGLKKELISIKEPDLDSKDPMRKAFRQFMGIVAELEKAFIAMRLSGGRIHKARKGGYAGGRAALGYVVKDKALSIDKTGAEIVRTIFDMNREGMSLRAIARALNGKGVPTARGGKWYAGTVGYMLSNSLYEGIYGYKGESASRPDLALV
jgi:DNA invertase Pin-like site-specific DNA recombinase